MDLQNFTLSNILGGFVDEAFVVRVGINEIANYLRLGTI